MNALPEAAARLQAIADHGGRPTFALYVEARWVRAAFVNGKGDRVSSIHASFGNEKAMRLYVLSLYPDARFV